MFLRWLVFVAWRPFETLCHRIPLVPLSASVTEPVPGVQRIQIGNWLTRALGKLGGYGYSTCYVVDHELMVDTGFPWAARRFRRLLRESGLHRSLNAVVCTHDHEDHVGNNALVRRETGAEIYAHFDALAEMRFPFAKPWYRRFLFGPYQPSEVRLAPAFIETTQRRLEVISLPGHCPGHVGLFDAERRWLFSGDLFISVDLDSQLSDADGPAWLESLESARALEAEVLFDGHGKVIVGRTDVRQALTEKLEFLRELARRTAAAMEHGPCSVQELTRTIFGRWGPTNAVSFSDGWLSVLTGSDFSRSNLVRSFVAAHQRLAATPSAPYGGAADAGSDA